MPNKMWLVRAGEKAYLVNEFLQNNVIAIGWNKTGNLSEFKSPETIKKLLKEKYPEYKPGKINMTAGQLSRFRFEFKQDDAVLTYDPERRKYYIGKITSDYKFDTSLLDMYHIRNVQWEGEVSRDDLSTAARNTLGSIATIIEIPKDVQVSINRILKGGSTTSFGNYNSNGDEIDELKEDIIEKAHEFIKDQVLGFRWDEMQELVAGLLKGMGYKARVSPKRPDRV